MISLIPERKAADLETCPSGQPFASRLFAAKASACVWCQAAGQSQHIRLHRLLTRPPHTVLVKSWHVSNSWCISTQKLMLGCTSLVLCDSVAVSFIFTGLTRELGWGSER